MHHRAKLNNVLKYVAQVEAGEALEKILGGLELPSKKCKLQCYIPELFLSHFSNDIAGMQLVIFEDKG